MRRLSNRFSAYVAIPLALASLPSCHRDHNEAATQLLTAFADGCHSEGQWTQAALAQTQALETVIASLQSADKCQGISTALGSVQSMSAEIQRLSTDPTVVAQKQAQENQRQLLIELADATDPALKASLAQAVAQADIQLAAANAQASVTADEQGNTALTRGLTQMSGYLSALLSAQGNLSSCSEDNPLLGVQIASGVLAIAGTFVNPAVGAGLAVAGNLLSETIDFARREGLERDIRQVQSTQMEAALACGLESMSNTYCEAQDAFTLAQLQADSYPAQWQPTAFWQGLDLWSRKVPGLIAWISKLASGVTPTDTYSADRMNDAWRAVNNLKAFERTSEGVIAFTEQLLSNPNLGAGAGGQREQTVRRGLKDLLNAMYGDTGIAGMNNSGPRSPIRNYYSSSAALMYRLVGLPFDCVASDFGGGTCKSADDIALPAGGFETIADDARAVFGEVSEQLLASLHLVIDVDPSGLLREATQASTVGAESPVEVMQDLVAFLSSSASYFSGLNTPEAGHLVPLIEDTQRILTDTVTAILTAPGTPEGDRDVVKGLFQKLNLVYGSDFISQRIYRHIHWDLDSRVEHGQAPADVADILRASGRDAALELAGAERDNLDRLAADISNSQSASQQNVEAFVSLFQDAFGDALQRLKLEADLAGEPLEGPHRPNRMMQARICMLLLTTQRAWPGGIDHRLCEGSELESIYPGLSEKLRFEDVERALAGKGLDQRMCTYQRFLRRSRLFATRPAQR